MAPKKSFFQALTSPPPKPVEKPSPWEKYLHDLINQLQQSNEELRDELKQAKQQIKQLEQQITHQEKQTVDIITKQINQVSPPTPSIQQESLVEVVISEIKERNDQDWIKKEIRVGGLREGWQEVEVLEDEEIEKDTYVPEHEILERKLSRAIPFIDIGEPSVSIKGKHVVLRYTDLQDKIKVMKQTHSLRGTKVWMADELTPLQLKSKKEELAKVYEARKQGKWAVYRYGKAVIEEFRNNKVDKGWIFTCS